jgi:hypothetical protein
MRLLLLLSLFLRWILPGRVLPLLQTLLLLLKRFSRLASRVTSVWQRLRLQTRGRTTRPTGLPSGSLNMGWKAAERQKAQP